MEMLSWIHIKSDLQSADFLYLVQVNRSNTDHGLISGCCLFVLCVVVFFKEKKNKEKQNKQTNKQKRKKERKKRKLKKTY